MMCFWFFTTRYLQVVKGYSPLAAGVAFFPLTVVNFVVAATEAAARQRRATGRWPRRHDGRHVLAQSPVADGCYTRGVALPTILIGAGLAPASAR